MKKIFLVCILAIASLVLFWGDYSEALIASPCVDCHTMHNSQNNLPMNFDGSPVPNEKLLRGDCVGCHAQNLAFNIVNNIPQVLHTNPTDLAGGNFRYYTTSHSNVHNVSNIVAIPQDAMLANTPPGFAAAYDPSAGDFQTTSRINCAGQNGCHGNRDLTNEWSAVSGGHHGIDNVLKFGSIVEGSQGADVPTSYRFLYSVHGGEVTGWVNVDQNTHNEYKGSTFAVRAAQVWADIDTISEFCAECHGNFHASAQISNQIPPVGTPWTRHPADAVIPAAGEYGSMTTTYSIETPVARTAIPIPNPSPTVTPGTDIVMCLSCHGAHGTNYSDILRFDYSTLASGDGCLRCHTNKQPY